MGNSNIVPKKQIGNLIIHLAKQAYIDKNVNIIQTSEKGIQI
jgi:hypothetical protein